MPLENLAVFDTKTPAIVKIPPRIPEGEHVNMGFATLVVK